MERVQGVELLQRRRVLVLRAEVVGVDDRVDDKQRFTFLLTSVSSAIVYTMTTGAFVKASGASRMDFRFTDEQQPGTRRCSRFMDKEVGREYTREHDESREFPYEAYQKMADHGWLGMLIPEEYGGMRPTRSCSRSSARRSPSSASTPPPA